MGRVLIGSVITSANTATKQFVNDAIAPLVASAYIRESDNHLILVFVNETELDVGALGVVDSVGGHFGIDTDGVIYYDSSLSDGPAIVLDTDGVPYFDSSVGVQSLSVLTDVDNVPYLV